MTRLYSLLAWAALLATAAAPLLYFFDRIGEPGLRQILLVATVVWFASSLLRDRRRID